MGTPARKVQLMITYPHLRRFFKKAPSLDEVREVLSGISEEMSEDVIKERGKRSSLFSEQPLQVPLKRRPHDALIRDYAG